MSTKIFDFKNFLKNLTNASGVYQMLDENKNIIYVGKAKSLKKRLQSYFRSEVDSVKTASLVRRIADIKIIVTQTENEALLLENNLIKAWRPRYNILFKDDKSYPYLAFSHHSFPRLDYFRSHKTPKGEYFGPYANSYAVKKVLYLIEKIFLLRNCSDSFFNHRSRPCLQYHIKRCSAPCVKYIAEEDYRKSANLAKLFLQGKNQQVIKMLTTQMDAAAEKEDFEKAAFLRDQIFALRQMDSEQQIQKGHRSVDVIVGVEAYQEIIIQHLMIREGKLIGDQAFYPDCRNSDSLAETLEYFIAQHYLNNDRAMASQILVNQALANQQWLAKTLSEDKKHSVHIKYVQRGENLRFIKMAEKHALQNLLAKQAEAASQKNRLQAVAKILNLENLKRIECFDISHTFGESTVASCVVFNEEGAAKKDYRLFNIKNVTKGDDYAAMRQVLQRRYKDATMDNHPDLVIIDGGKAQLQQAIDVFKALSLPSVTLLGVAKGPTRKAGFEILWLAGKETPLTLDPHSSAMHLIQQIRDEAHRFAITRHRAKRAKSRRESVLEKIEGVGSKKRQALLKHFGGIQGLKEASIADILKVPGIHQILAQKIYDHLRG